METLAFKYFSHVSTSLVDEFQVRGYRVIGRVVSQRGTLYRKILHLIVIEI